MPEDTKYIINESQLTAIGSAIRSKLGEQTLYTVDQMPTKIGNISGGGSNVPMCQVKIVNTSSSDYDYEIQSLATDAIFSPEGAILDYQTITIPADEPLTLNVAISKNVEDESIYYTVILTGMINNELHETSDYSNMITELNNVQVVVTQLPSDPIMYAYGVNVIDITKPSSFTLTIDFSQFN